MAGRVTRSDRALRIPHDDRGGRFHLITNHLITNTAAGNAIN